MLTAEPETEATPIDAYVIALDETHNYFISREDAPFIKSIRGIYLFDRAERTYCCEMTPSYYLIHIYDEVECQPGASDERREGLWEKYESCGGEPRYVHCHTVEAIIKAARRFTVYYCGDTGVSFDDVCRDDQLEALHEHYNGNHPL